MKILIFILLISLAAVSGIGAAFGEDFSINIVFDVEADSTTFAQGDPVAIFMTASNPKAMNAHYGNLAAGKEVSGIPQVTLGAPA